MKSPCRMQAAQSNEKRIKPLSSASLFFAVRCKKSTAIRLNEGDVGGADLT